jgi:hypothetical protein
MVSKKTLTLMASILKIWPIEATSVIYHRSQHGEKE